MPDAEPPRPLDARSEARAAARSLLGEDPYGFALAVELAAPGVQGLAFAHTQGLELSGVREGDARALLVGTDARGAPRLQAAFVDGRAAYRVGPAGDWGPLHRETAEGFSQLLRTLATLPASVARSGVAVRDENHWQGAIPVAEFAGVAAAACFFGRPELQRLEGALEVQAGTLEYSAAIGDEASVTLYSELTINNAIARQLSRGPQSRDGYLALGLSRGEQQLAIRIGLSRLPGRPERVPEFNLSTNLPRLATMSDLIRGALFGMQALPAAVRPRRQAPRSVEDVLSALALDGHHRGPLPVLDLGDFDRVD